MIRLINAITLPFRAYAHQAATDRKFRAVFKCVSTSKASAHRVDSIARRLLVDHIIRGETLASIERGLDTRERLRAGALSGSIIDTNTGAPYRTHTGARSGERNEGWKHDK